MGKLLGNSTLNAVTFHVEERLGRPTWEVRYDLEYEAEITKWLPARRGGCEMVRKGKVDQKGGTLDNFILLRLEVLSDALKAE